MSAPYTPTIMKVRYLFIRGRMEDAGLLGEPILPTQRFHDEFDRFIAEHDRQVAEQAWDAGRNDNAPRAVSQGTNTEVVWPHPDNPHRKAEADE